MKATPEFRLTPLPESENIGRFALRIGVLEAMTLGARWFRWCDRDDGLHVTYDVAWDRGESALLWKQESLLAMLSDLVTSQGDAELDFVVGVHRVSCRIATIASITEFRLGDYEIANPRDALRPAFPGYATGEFRPWGFSIDGSKAQYNLPTRSPSRQFLDRVPSFGRRWSPRGASAKRDTRTVA